MTIRINRAVLTDTAAKEHIKEHDHIYGGDSITAFQAKSMYNSYIFDKQNFICSTDGCSAPITCRSITKNSKNKPVL